MDPQLRAESYKQQQIDIRQIIGARDVERRTRLVWYVGLCGYGLLNGRPLWESVLGRPAMPLEILALSAPWVTTALLALATYMLTDAYDDASDRFHILKVASINSYLFNRDFDQDPGEVKWIAVVEGNVGDVKRLENTLTQRARRRDKGMVVAQIFLAISFAWTVIGPSVIWRLI